MFRFVFAGCFFINTIGAIQYELIDIGKECALTSSYATVINNNGQVAGAIDSCRLWFKWDEQTGLVPFPVYLNSSVGPGPGCPPYFDNADSLTLLSFNDLGDYVYVVEEKLYLFEQE